MTDTAAKRVSYDIGCMKSLRKLPDRITAKFMDMMTRYMSDPSGNGLNLETVQGAKDNAIKSLRIDQGHRAIAFEVGQDIMFVHVNEHDKAYRWAAGRRVKLDPETNRIRVIEEIEVETASASNSTEPGPWLFTEASDKRLRALGVPEEELPAIRRLVSLEELEAHEDRFDPTTFQVLYALAAGYSDEEVYSLTGLSSEGIAAETTSTAPSFGALIETEESRQTIFIPETEAELRRSLRGRSRRLAGLLAPGTAQARLQRLERSRHGSRRSRDRQDCRRYAPSQISCGSDRGGPEQDRAADPFHHFHDQPRAGYRGEPYDTLSGAP